VLQGWTAKVKGGAALDHFFILLKEPIISSFRVSCDCRIRLQFSGCPKLQAFGASCRAGEIGTISALLRMPMPRKWILRSGISFC